MQRSVLRYLNNLIQGASNQNVNMHSHFKCYGELNNNNNDYLFNSNKYWNLKESYSRFQEDYLAAVIAKVLDSVFVNELKKGLQLHDGQFGFRPETSTEIVVLDFKHMIGTTLTHTSTIVF